MRIINLIKKHSKIIKFLIVWSVSTLIDLGFLYVFIEVLHLQLFIWVILSFLISVINWFILNKFWTFKDRSIKYKRQFTKFLFVSMIWLFLTLTLMFLLTVISWVYYLLAKIITSLILVIWNFLWNKYWTFSIKQNKYNEKNNFSIKYSIIIPAYNEEKRLATTLKKINIFLENKKDKFEIIVINDGSTDKTTQIIKKLKIKNLKIFNNKTNKWKGYSVKKWILLAKWKLILFTDADNSTPIEELSKLEKFINSFDIVIWSRYCKKSRIKVKQWYIRQKIGRLWNKVIQILLLDWINDTQCWFKLFKHNAAKNLFSLQKINWFWFDMEILLAGKSMWYKIKEVPIDWYHSQFSKVRPVKDYLKTLLELIFIKINYWFDWYK